MEIWHEYAEKIQSGEIVACKKIKQAIARYFNDLNNPDYFFDQSAVENLSLSRNYARTLKDTYADSLLFFQIGKSFSLPTF